MPNQSNFLRLFQQIQNRQICFAHRNAFFFHVPQQAANSCMGILNIVNRILRGLFHSQIQIKFKVRICFSGVKEESCCINRNFIQQGYQCDCLSAPLGQLYDFAVPHQHYHLHQNNIQPVCICPHCSQGCFQAWYIAVVVSTQNINRTVKVSGLS